MNNPARRKSPDRMKINGVADEIREQSPDESKAILDSDKKEEYFQIDARQPEECESGHLPGSMLISLGEFETRRMRAC
jgi:rhodanese-related sulfurtransferase